MRQPPWMAEAWAELGLREAAGAPSNPRIVELFREAGHPDVTTDSTAWCAAFTGAMLARAGLPASGSLLARSYLAWGQPLDAPRLGAVAILTRGHDPAAGHVGFWVGETSNGIVLLGGNQSNAVTVSSFERARVLGLRWPSEVSENAASGLDSPLFDHCLLHVLDMEGGFSDDPYDPGGPTNRGITLAVFARHTGTVLTDRNRGSLVKRLVAITPATVRAIYLERYWRPCRAAAMPPALALMHFDASVNHGVIGAAKLLQSVLDVEVDGEIGPLTMAAIAGRSPLGLLRAYADARRERYRALPHFWRFGAGWLNRVVATERAAVTLHNAPSTTKGSDMSEAKATNTPVPSTAPSSQVGAPQPKWWGESLTIWGTIVTTLSTVLPIIAPLVGLDLTPDLVRKLGDQTLVVIQAIGGLTGTIMTIVGRFRAATPLSRRSMTIQL